MEKLYAIIFTDKKTWIYSDDDYLTQVVSVHPTRKSAEDKLESMLDSTDCTIAEWEKELPF